MRFIKQPSYGNHCILVKEECIEVRLMQKPDEEPTIMNTRLKKGKLENIEQALAHLTRFEVLNSGKTFSTMKEFNMELREQFRKVAEEYEADTSGEEEVEHEQHDIATNGENEGNQEVAEGPVGVQQT
jgi:hypothetical protein